jgi:hypothetical protein
VVMGENRELDQGGLRNVGGILLGSSDYRPIVETNWHVVSEVLLAVAQYQPFNLDIVIHFRMK